MKVTVPEVRTPKPVVKSPSLQIPVATPKPVKVLTPEAVMPELRVKALARPRVRAGIATRPGLTLLEPEVFRFPSPRPPAMEPLITPPPVTVTAVKPRARSRRAGGGGRGGKGRGAIPSPFPIPPLPSTEDVEEGLKSLTAYEERFNPFRGNPLKFLLG